MFIKIHKWLDNTKGTNLGSEIAKSEKEYNRISNECSNRGYYIEEEWVSLLESRKKK